VDTRGVAVDQGTGGGADVVDLSDVDKLGEQCFGEGNPAHCHNFALALIERNGPEDRDHARGLLNHLCRFDGIGSACTLLAANIEQGRLEGSHEEAATFANAACSIGEPDACHVLGVALYKSPDHSDTEAQHAFQKACDLGYERSCPIAKKLDVHSAVASP